MSSGNLAGLVIAWTVVGLVFMTPPAVYWTVIYHRRKHDTIIRLRRPRLATVANGFAIYYIAVHAPLHLLMLLMEKGHSADDPWERLFDAFGYELAFISYFLRAWHVWYDFNYNKAMGNNYWLSVIDGSSAADASNNFFLKHSRTLGYPKFTRLVGLAYLALYIISIFVVSWWYGSVSDYLAVVFMLSLLIPILFLIVSLSRARDHVFIREELLTQCVLMFIGALSETIVGSFLPHHDSLIMLLDAIIPSIVMFLMIASTTVFVFWKEKRNLIAQSLAVGIQSQNSDTVSTFHKDMKSLLATRDGFEIFSSHLVKEFSLENLLFVVECTQFICNCASNLEDSTTRENVLAELFSLPSTLPQSRLLHDNPTDRDQFLALYSRYIDTAEAQWEINISSSSRRALVKLRKSLDEQYSEDAEERYSRRRTPMTITLPKRDSKAPAPVFTKTEVVNMQSSALNVLTQTQLAGMFKAFDAAMYDVIKCLKDSYGRFVATPQYANLDKHLSGKRAMLGSVSIGATMDAP